MVLHDVFERWREPLVFIGGMAGVAERLQDAGDAGDSAAERQPCSPSQASLTFRNRLARSFTKGWTSGSVSNMAST